LSYGTASRRVLSLI